MKQPITIKSIKASRNEGSLSTACDILGHRPGLTIKKRQGYDKRKERLNALPPHSKYFYGFEDGYRYAIDRLRKHS